MFNTTPTASAEEAVSQSQASSSVSTDHQQKAAEEHLKLYGTADSDELFARFSASSSKKLGTYEVEPNDTKAKADWIQTEKGGYGRIQKSGDLDYWKIKAPSNGKIKIQLSQIPNGQNYDLYLYDSEQRELAKSVKSGSADEGIEPVTTEKNQWYYLVVKGAGNSSHKSGYYHVNASYLPTAPDTQPDPFESNNTFDTAKPFPLNSPQVANLHQKSDVDYYKISPTLSSTIDLTLTDFPTGIDLDLYLYDPNKKLVAKSENAGSKDEKISYNGDAGTHYLKVAMSSRSAYKTHTYKLSAQVQTLPVILIPGIGGSRLLAKAPMQVHGGQEVMVTMEAWPNLGGMILNPNDTNHRRLLTLKPKSANSVKMVPTDDRVTVYPEADEGGFKAIAYLSYMAPAKEASEQYQSMIAHLERMGYQKNKTLFALPYDWRFSATDNAVFLKNKIDQALQQSQAKQVQIVVHSMGGLLVRETLLGSVSYQKKTKRIIYMGTPFLGSPYAYRAIKFGHNFNISAYGYEPLSNETGRLIAQYAPAVYELLPSKNYVKKQSYLTLVTAKSKRALNYDEINSDPRVKVSYRPLAKSAGLKQEKWETKQIYVPQYRIIGDSRLTFTGYEFHEANNHFEPVFGNQGGDDTVPIHSASFKMKDIIKDYYIQEGHSLLPRNPYVIQQVAHLLLGITDVQKGMRTSAENVKNYHYTIITVNDEMTNLVLTHRGESYSLNSRETTPKPFQIDRHDNVIVILWKDNPESFELQTAPITQSSPTPKKSPLSSLPQEQPHDTNTTGTITIQHVFANADTNQQEQKRQWQLVPGAEPKKLQVTLN